MGNSTLAPTLTAVDSARWIINDLKSENPRGNYDFDRLTKREKPLVEACAQVLSAKGCETQQKRCEAIDRILDSYVERNPDLHYLLPSKEQPVVPEGDQEEHPYLITNKHNKKQFRLYSDKDILEFPDLEFMVGGMLPKVGTTLVVATSGTGKTFFAIDLANHIARGMDWKGRQVKQPGRVLFIYAEGKLGLKPRSLAWRKHFTDVDDLADNIDYMPYPINLSSAQDIVYLEETIRAMQEEDPYCLIILDTFSNMAPGVDQNKQEGVTDVLSRCNRLADEWGVQILITHHTNKQNNFNGSQSFMNHVDTFIELSSEEATSSIIKVRCEKQRGGAAKFDDFFLSRQLVDIGFNGETLEPIRDCVLVACESNVINNEMEDLNTQEQMLDILKIHTRLSVRKWQTYSREVGVSYRAFYRQLPILREHECVQWIKADKKGKSDSYEFAEQKSEEQNE